MGNKTKNKKRVQSSLRTHLRRPVVHAPQYARALRVFAVTVVFFGTLFALYVSNNARYFVSAADGAAVGYGQTATLTGPDAVCKQVTNNHISGLTLFVPLLTVVEWQAFVTHPPAGVTLAPCTLGTGTFATKVDQAVGTNPYALDVGDVNGDGRIDIVTANYNANSVTTLINNGDGTFTRNDYATAQYPFGVAVGDVNQDGAPDIVTDNNSASGGAGASVLLNNGNGTFAAHVDYATGANGASRGVTLADVSGDGALDIGTANRSGQNTVSVLLNSGAGTFASRTDYGATNPYGVTFADVNGDSKKDMLAANYGAGSAAVWLNNGSGAFLGAASYATGANPVSVASADINADGSNDMAVANFGSGTVSVLFNSGTGTFGGKTDYATGANPNYVLLGNLNADQKPDLVVVMSFANVVKVYLNDGTGVFGAPASYATGSFPSQVARADINGDGKPDLVTANVSSNSVSILLNN